MVQRKTICTGLWVLALVTALALAQPLLLTGCGGCQQQEPSPTPTPAPKAETPKAPEAPKAEPVKAEPPKPALAPMGEVVPVTYDLLKLAPQSTMITLALPPLTGVLDKGVAFAKRILPAEANVDEAVADAIKQTAGDAGVPDAKSLAEIAAAKGLKADAPMAVYIDLSPSAASAKEALDKLKAEAEAKKAAAAPAEAKEGDAAKAEGDAEKKEGDAPAAEVKANTPEMPDFNDLAKSLKEPAVGVVLGCSDAAKAEATIKEILDLAGGYVDPAKVEDSEVDGVKVHCYDPAKFAYAVAGDKLMASNSLAMLRDMLARVKAPAAVRYGTTDCPASVADEAVLSIQADKIAPIVKDLYPALMATAPGSKPLTDAQKASIDRSLDAMQGDDPLVTTLAWTDKKIELLTRYDLAKHPKAAEETGEVKPARLATMLPDNTAVMLCLRLNDKAKQMFKDGWLTSLPQELNKDDGLTQAMTYVNQIVDMVGDELSIGISGGVGGMPQLVLLAGLSKPDVAKGMLEMFAQLTPQDPYKNVEITLLSLPLPMPFYLAFAGDLLIVANDLEKIKGVIDLNEAKKASNFFASLDPALDPAHPMLGAMLVKSSIVTEVVIPMLSMFGGVPAEMQMPIDKTTSVLREIRMVKDLNGSWVESRLSLLLK